MIIATDITNWMAWWVDEVVYILTACYTMLDSIQFAGTSVLKVILGIMLLSAFLPVILTLLRGAGEPLMVASERIREPILINKAVRSRKFYNYEYDSRLSGNINIRSLYADGLGIDIYGGKK